MKKTRGSSLVGVLVLFLSVAAVVSVSVLTFSLLLGRVKTGTIIAIMLIETLLLSGACVALDVIRRNLTTDKTVREILAATDAVAKGDFSIRLNVKHPYRRYDEFDYIIENLNKMADDLSRNEMLKSDFISNVSHELKTPLAVIKNYAACLADDKLDAGTRKKYAETLVNASARLSDLTVNILKLNKLENKKITPEYKKFRLDEQLAEVILAFEDLIEKKKINLECDLAETEIFSLPDYLEIVWNNLVSNALKFTDEGGGVYISLKEENGKAEIKVRDTGCGISKDVGAHIFEKFYQGNTSHSGEGNGLGLALVKKVIDIIGGEISVESETGVGSCFTVRLSVAG